MARTDSDEFGAWVDPFAVLWERTVGRPDKPKLGQVIWPLIERYGAPQVYATWDGYLREGRGQKWISVRHFAGTYLAIRDRWALQTDMAGVEAAIPDLPGDLDITLPANRVAA